MDKKKIEYIGAFQRLWNDQVLSQIISVFILWTITTLYALLQSIFNKVSFIQIFLATINFQIELYKILIFFAISVLIFIVIFKWRQRKNKYFGKFDIEQIVGDFSFRELYNALLTHRIDLPASLRSSQPDSKCDLLTLFILYQRQLNIGIEWDHPGDQGNFMYNSLAPTLMTYGLAEKASSKNKTDSLGLDIIQTSEVGYKFYALLERWRVYNNEIMNDDISKTETKQHKNT